MKKIILYFLPILLLSCGSSDDNTHQTQETDRYKSIPFIAESFLPEDGTTFKKTNDCFNIMRDVAFDKMGISSKKYLDYGFIGLASCQYEVQGKKLSVEISQFASNDEAFGFYALLRPIGTATETIGIEGYFSGKSLYFCQGKFAVTISSLEDDDSGNQLCNLFAVQISARIGPTGSMPEQFAFFPVDNRISPSEKYTPKNYIMIEKLTDVYSITILHNEDSLQLFVAIDTSGNQYFELSQYADNNGQNVITPTDLSFDDNYSLSFSHPTYGVILAGLKSQKLVGVVNYNEIKHKPFIEAWLNSIL